MKILVVEDDKTVGDYVRRGLDEAGYHVELVGDGDEGLRRASGRGAGYDMMVLDLRLPKLSGIDVLRTLRDRGVGVPVLVLTAQDSVDFKVQALRMGRTTTSPSPSRSKNCWRASRHSGAGRRRSFHPR